MTNFKINERGFWESESAIGHLHDPILAHAILQILKQENLQTLLDLGCGMADYVKYFISNGIECEAFDGNPNTKKLTSGLADVIDLSQDFNLKKTYDCVLSLEVGEHIPKQFEQTFINNVVLHSKKWIIMSWAVLGQGGDGHVNCQNNDFIISELNKRGCDYHKSYSDYLRFNCYLPWFKNTIMVFEKK